jgi:hypothetical protein
MVPQPIVGLRPLFQLLNFTRSLWYPVERGSALRKASTYTQSTQKQTNKQTLWPESASELYRPRYHLLSAKLVPTFADRGCHVVSVTDPYGHNFGLLNPTQTHTHTRIHTLSGFEPRNPVFEYAKTVRALYRATTLIDFHAAIPIFKPAFN